MKNNECESILHKKRLWGHEDPEEKCIKLEKFVNRLQALLDQEQSLSKRSMMSKRNCFVELGMRVVRGPDWKWSDQDEGEGHVGTVVEIGRVGSSTSPDKTVVVQWDSGIQTNYRIGFQNSYDLRIVDSAPSGVRHPNHPCSICNARVIVGHRWHCPEDGYDLCNPCYMSNQHDVSRPFLRYDRNNDEVGVDVPPRKTSVSIPLWGVFPSAVVQRGPDWDWGNQDGGETNVGTVLEVSGWDEESARSVVTIKWTSTSTTNVYRMGHKGKVDVKYVKGREASFGTYYPDHLPVLGQDPRQRPQPKKQVLLSVGDKVKICVDVETLRTLQSGHGGYSPRMTELIGKVGIVHRFTDKGDVRVQYSGRPIENNRWTLNLKALVKVTNFEIGSLVRILDDVDKVRRLQDGHGEWTDCMTNALGKTGRVIKVYPDGDLRVSVNASTWTFNPACLSSLDPNPEYRHHLVTLASQGDLDRIKDELKRVTDLRAVRSALSAAAQGGYQDVVKYLVNQYPDEVDVIIGGQTALHAATHKGQIHIMELLLLSGANVATPDDDGDCALHYAALGSKSAALDFLLNYCNGSGIDAVNKKKCSPLHVAVMMKDVDSVSVLLKHKADVNLQDAYEDTPLHEAIKSAPLTVIDSLCSHPKTDFTLCNRRGFNALQYAAVKGNVEAVRSILSRTTGITDLKKSADGFSALHLACLNGHLSVVETLLEVGRGRADIRDDRGQTGLHLAASQGHASVVEALVTKYRLNVDSEDKNGDTALHLILGREDKGDGGTNYSYADAPQMTALAENEGNKMVKSRLRRSLVIALFLIRHGAEINRRNHAGISPLDLVTDSVEIQLLSRRLNDLVECRVCSEETDNAVTFHPCGHRIVCQECWTPRIKKCLECKITIVNQCGSKAGVLEDLEAKVRDFEDQYLCTICMERKKNVAFQCGHSACSKCVETLRSCHMCRGSVDKRINLY